MLQEGACREGSISVCRACLGRVGRKEAQDNGTVAGWEEEARELLLFLSMGTLQHSCSAIRTTKRYVMISSSGWKRRNGRREALDSERRW